MIKTVLSILLVAIFICPSGAYSLEIKKVTPSLQYLYNYYYDPGALETWQCWVLENTKYKLHTTSPEVTNQVYKQNNRALFFIDSVPYVGADLTYRGDRDDLRALGVITGANYAGVAARFPLSILPQVAALSSVSAIRDNAIIADLNIDFSLGNTQSDDKCGVISGRIIGCDAIPETISYITIYRLIKRAKSGRPAQFIIDYFFNEIQFYTNDSGYFVSPALPQGHYKLRIDPINEYGKRDAITIDNNNPPVVDIPTVLCNIVKTNVRVAVDSVSVVNIRLTNLSIDIYPTPEPVFHLWQGIIVPNKL